MGHSDMIPSHNATGSYRHFDGAIYAHMVEVQQMADLDWLRLRFEVMSRHIKVSKVYLETHRDTIVADEEKIGGRAPAQVSRGR